MAYLEFEKCGLKWYTTREPKKLEYWHWLDTLAGDYLSIEECAAREYLCIEERERWGGTPIWLTHVQMGEHHSSVVGKYRSTEEAFKAAEEFHISWELDK